VCVKFTKLVTVRVRRFIQVNRAASLCSIGSFELRKDAGPKYVSATMRQHRSTDRLSDEIGGADQLIPVHRFDVVQTGRHWNRYVVSGRHRSNCFTDGEAVHPRRQHIEH
jgi:hypothetical protein